MPRPVRRGRLRVVRGAPPEVSSPSQGTPLPLVAATFLIPGLGHFVQGRRRAAAGHLLCAVVVYVVATRRGWPASLLVGALLVLSLWSAADATRAERVARRAPLRLV